CFDGASAVDPGEDEEDDTCGEAVAIWDSGVLHALHYRYTYYLFYQYMNCCFSFIVLDGLMNLNLAIGFTRNHASIWNKTSYGTHQMLMYTTCVQVAIFTYIPLVPKHVLSEHYFWYWSYVKGEKTDRSITTLILNRGVSELNQVQFDWQAQKSFVAFSLNLRGNNGGERAEKDTVVVEQMGICTCDSNHYEIEYKILEVLNYNNFLIIDDRNKEVIMKHFLRKTTAVTPYNDILIATKISKLQHYCIIYIYLYIYFFQTEFNERKEREKYVGNQSSQEQEQISKKRRRRILGDRFDGYAFSPIWLLLDLAV
ncbi:hypothetical protein ACJX0J_017576, partial [Zea mays]